MVFEIQTGGDKGHHAKAHKEAEHKLRDEAHKLFQTIHHGFDKAKPHLNHAAHGLEQQAHSLGGSLKREIHGNATPADKHKLETVGKIAATVLLPHVTIGTELAKTGIDAIKHASHKSNVHHVEHHNSVKHGDSKM